MDLNILKTIQKNFLKELEDAKEGKKTSLPFIVHELPKASLVGEGEVFEVIVIGGSICNKALLKKEQGEIKILKKELINPAYLKKEQNIPDFVSRHIYPDVEVLAINLAYPLNPIFEEGKLDGILVSGSKEYAFKEMLGKKLGKEIEKFVWKNNKRKLKVSIANDTICLLLSGLTRYKWYELVGGVLGTGLNFAFFLSETQVVNLEAANFDKFPQSEEGKAIDKKSIHPGRSLIEKEVSGAYLYQIFNLGLQNKNINHASLSSTRQLDSLMLSDDKKVAGLAKEVMMRASELAACEIGGIALFKNRDLVFVMEGSLFWVGLGFKRHIVEVLDKTIKTKVQFVKVEDSTILGAAALVSY